MIKYLEQYLAHGRRTISALKYWLLFSFLFLFFKKADESNLLYFL